jgi:uncharacterized protein YndB with AHSA1/START domain
VTAGELSPCSSDEAAGVTVVQGNTVSVERVINAPAAQIFALIADAGKHSSVDGSGTHRVENHDGTSHRPMLKVGSMPKQAEDGMRATLERVAALLEP